MSHHLKRVFVALEFEGQWSSQFLDMYRKLKITSDKSEIQVKWSPMNNLHLTLKFLGDISDEQIATATTELKKICQNVAPFELQLRGVGAFENELEARVIWVGVQNKVVLGDLWQMIESAFVSHGFLPADQDFSPHITLGRLRNKQSVKSMIAPFLRKDYGVMKVNKIMLYESHLQNYYPVYKVIEEFVIG